MKSVFSTAVFSLAVLFFSAFGVQAATYTVTNTNDDGAGSLRDAVNQTNDSPDEDTIVFDASVFAAPRVITLTGGQIDIKGSLTINGPGAGLLTVSGNRQSRIFFSNYSSSFIKINNLTLKHGFAPDGGAIYTGDTLYLSDVVITENTAKEESSGGNQISAGGGIYAGSELTIVNSIISNNSAIGVVVKSNSPHFYQGDFGTDAQGGGVYVMSSNTTIINCVFTGNKAEGADAPDAGEINEGGNGGWASGGAIKSTSSVKVINSTFANNSAIGGDGGSIINRFAQGGDGGNAEGGAFSGDVTVLNSTINNNTAVGGNGGVISGSNGGKLGLGGRADGGAIQNGNSVFNTTIVENKAIAGSGLKGGNAFGGALIAGSIRNSTITGNSATGGPGTESNGIGYAGGVFSNNSWSGSFYNNIIAENSAVNGPDVYGDFPYTANNLIGNGDGAPGFTNGVNANIVGSSTAPVNPRLAPLSNNGGLTETRALLPQSPAVDAGNKSYSTYYISSENGLQFDQRNFERVFPAGGAVDIGAFELGASKLMSPSIPVFQGVSSSTGTGSTDIITKAVLAVFNISNVIPGAKVELLRDNVVISSTTADNFTVSLSDVSPPRDGAVKYTSRQTIAGVISEPGLPLNVTYDNTPPEITINQAPTQADPTNIPTIRFIVTSSEPIGGIARANISFDGSTADLTNSAVWVNAVNATTFSVEITSPRSPGLIVISIAPQAFYDRVFNRGVASHVIDNSVNFQPGSMEVNVSGRIRKSLGLFKTPPVITLTDPFTGESRTARANSLGYYQFSTLKVYQQIGTRFEVRISGKGVTNNFINSVIITGNRNNLNYVVP